METSEKIINYYLKFDDKMAVLIKKNRKVREFIFRFIKHLVLMKADKLYFTGYFNGLMHGAAPARDLVDNFYVVSNFCQKILDDHFSGVRAPIY